MSHLKGIFRVYDPNPSFFNRVKNKILRGDPNCEAEKDETIVLGFCDMIAAGMNNITNVGVPQALGKNGVACNVAPTASCISAAGDSNNGICAGRGAPTPVTIASFALDTPIVHGAGANQLQYGLQSYVVPTTAGASRVFIMRRTLTNIGVGADITITNVGVFCYVAAMGNYVMIDKTNVTITVPNGGNKTVTYTLTVTVP